jgi:hypothetical protein
MTTGAWTDAEDAILLAAADDGVPAAVTAARLGRTVHAVQIRLSKVRRVRGLSAPAGWTKADDDALLADVAAGVLCADIAARMGRSVPAVHQRLYRLRQVRGVAKADVPRARYPVHGWTAADDARILEDAARFVPQAETAQALGRTAKAVTARLARLRAAEGLPVRRRPAPAGTVAWSDADDARLRHLRKQRLTIPEIVAAMPGRTEGAVSSRLDRLGLLCPGRAVEAAPVPVAPSGVVPVVRVVPVAAPVVVSGFVPVWAEALSGVQRDYARWVAGVDCPAPWTAWQDAALVHDVFAGVGVRRVVALLGLGEGPGVARFMALTDGLRDARGRLPADTSSIVMPVLRARAGFEMDQRRGDAA